MYLSLAGFDQNFADLEVKHFVVPSTGQDVVAHTGQGVVHEEVSVPQNESLRHLNDANRFRKIGKSVPAVPTEPLNSKMYSEIKHQNKTGLKR